MIGASKSLHQTADLPLPSPLLRQSFYADGDALKIHHCLKNHSRSCNRRWSPTTSRMKKALLPLPTGFTIPWVMVKKQRWWICYRAICKERMMMWNGLIKLYHTITILPHFWRYHTGCRQSAGRKSQLKLDRHQTYATCCCRCSPTLPKQRSIL